MSIYTEILGLNPEDLNNVADASIGYASYLASIMENPDNKGTNTLPWIASSYLLAASLKSVIDPLESSQVYSLAASFYKLADNPYWKIAAICGYDNEIITYKQIANDNTTFSNSLFYDLLSYILLENNTSSLFRMSERWGQQPISRLGIPLGYFSSAIGEIQNGRPNDANGFSSLKILLSRAAENIAILRADNYHWGNFKGTFLAVEPEILAFCICLCKIWTNRNMPSDELLRGTEGEDIVFIPLRIAIEITDNRSLERPYSHKV
ncbi:hypothetical protein [Chitinophaga sancti]|uniref:Immunity protein 49 n=1 Tax=Chitinophaga sancti TaxID=1004 RepID=A0A1K1SYM7_9BACT|nr:hypothetical protein [Chitinophaga sancti]WQD63938.1 hypothetical protein U0033_05980 [Chitinophaga sancti]WQG90437.1 hypothetical protein SR876_02940 [Chitinophaga sancti]SFW89382.1 hypothetical protein SAMN05661012_06421 [Chitinophaga sancti]